MNLTVVTLVAFLAWGGVGCRCDRPASMTAQSSASADVAPSSNTVLTADVQPTGGVNPWPELEWYKWVEDSSRLMPKPVETAMHRFAGSLPGYTVFAGEAESWTEWLRLLPLAAPGTPVRNYRGEIVVPGDDEHLAAVVAIDVGTQNIQQSGDVILRLHAEWRWWVNDLRMLYLSDAKVELPLQKWVAGERLVASEGKPTWVRQAEPKPKLDYADFRAYLDSVFTWSDGQALLAESVPLAPESLEPGAFFLHEGHPAQVLIVLDVATSQDGKRAMLLAQAQSPGESLHVIRPNRNSVWFSVRTDQPVRVPRAKAYGWKELRRLKPLRSRPEVECIGSLCPQAKPPLSADPGARSP
jgi:hypothetical protein